MEAPTITRAEDILEITRWDEELMDLIAFELWRRGCCPEAESEPGGADTEPWRHASCL